MATTEGSKRTTPPPATYTNRVYFEQGHEAGERMVAEFIAKKGA